MCFFWELAWLGAITNAVIASGIHISGWNERDLVPEAPYVVGARRSPRRIPGDGVDHGTTHYKLPPGLMAGWNSPRMDISAAYLFRNGRYFHAGGPH